MSALPVMFEYCDEKPLEGLKWDIECICEYGAVPIEVGVALLMTGVIWPPKDPPNPLADGGLGEVLVWYPLAVPSKEVFPLHMVSCQEIPQSSLKTTNQSQRKQRQKRPNFQFREGLVSSWRKATRDLRDPCSPVKWWVRLKSSWWRNCCSI